MQSVLVVVVVVFLPLSDHNQGVDYYYFGVSLSGPATTTKEKL